MKVLIVEDNQKLMDTYENALETSFDIVTAYDIESAKKVVKTQRIAVAILDIMLPDGNGYDLIPYIKRHSNAIVIMVSALGQEETKRMAYECGADDYMTKPVTLFELSYKLKAIASRQDKEKLIYQIGDLVLDLEKLTLSSDFGEIQLPHSQAVLLKLLYDKYKSDSILYKKDIASLESTVNIENFRIHTSISRLRKSIESLETNNVFIENVYGKGYALVVIK
ncbi:response regulator transcription factor [Fusibacter paucivorans]|uniref:Stage 0 sporulation protein A homolog n=1 Tax=Fusibacter paucivorans TaxID=76009 RepID=A0ABS5PLN6_9FIRM|nr:response regulator transcription factor [Fusibacter paucivorans]MBS7525261.1 response regulator transcription factor [Fusibacter paucivorans]